MSLQETHYTSSEKLILPSFALAGLSLSRKNGLATFVHERLKYTLSKPSPPKLETECLCVDLDGYKIVNAYKPPTTRLQASDLPVLPHLCFDAVTLTTRMLTGALVTTVRMDSV